uniref:Uncharacterized protein n=1 Tax=Leersia perrieri TaxID=77586 RepID=A0A0D9X326_9ORYZ
MSFHGDGGGALSRQGSVYSLTMNEVESHLGEPLRSMNLDDLLSRAGVSVGAGGGGAHWLRGHYPPPPAQQLQCALAVADFSTFPSCVDFLKAFLTQKLEPVVQFVPQPEPKQELRRTNSASF